MVRKTSFAVIPAIVLAATLGVDGQAPAGQGGGQGQARGAAPPLAPMAIKQIKPGLFMVTGIGGNSTVRVTEQGVAKEQIRQQIQAQLPDMAPWMMTGVVNDMRLDAFYAELSNAK